MAGIKRRRTRVRGSEIQAVHPGQEVHAPYAESKKGLDVWLRSLIAYALSEKGAAAGLGIEGVTQGEVIEGSDYACVLHVAKEGKSSTTFTVYGVSTSRIRSFRRVRKGAFGKMFPENVVNAQQNDMFCTKNP